MLNKFDTYQQQCGISAINKTCVDSQLVIKQEVVLLKTKNSQQHYNPCKHKVFERMNANATPMK